MSSLLRITKFHKADGLAFLAISAQRAAMHQGQFWQFYSTCCCIHHFKALLLQIMNVANINNTLCWQDFSLPFRVLRLANGLLL